MRRPSFLLRDSPPGGPSRWLDFGAPLETHAAWRQEEVLPQLAAVEAAVEQGAWAIGFLAYEAAAAFDDALQTGPADPDWPLAFWAITKEPHEILLPLPSSPRSQLDWRPLLSEQEHAEAVGEIRAAIARGETYQANFTFPLEARFGGDPFDLFLALNAAQQGRHAAFLDLGELAVLSASPELFFRRDGEEIVVRPMKGTSRRGRYGAEEAASITELRSEKNRAENLMIVDMMRNDLGKIALPGSVRVASLFAHERYPTVHQLVSEVHARSRVSQLDLLRALFPCASITGAPKAATMRLLRRLERWPRGVYTGAVGYLAPGRRASFSVAIRTISWQRAAPELPARVRFGTGGGIVWDSNAAAEYRECQAKALVLHSAGTAAGGTAAGEIDAAPFELFETLLFRPRSGYFLLARHLERLVSSAAFFGFACDRQRLADALTAAAASFPAGRCRVRLVLDRAGQVEITATAMPCAGRREDLKLFRDAYPVDENDALLFHKTTRRQRYDEARQRWEGAARGGDFEVALWNSRGELTETTRGNLVLRLGRDYLTPALDCGLLAGVYRAELLARGRIREAVLPLAALAEADEVFHISALRGWWRAQWQG